MSDVEPSIQEIIRALPDQTAIAEALNRIGRFNGQSRERGGPQDPRSEIERLVNAIETNKSHLSAQQWEVFSRAQKPRFQRNRPLPEPQPPANRAPTRTLS